MLALELMKTYIVKTTPDATLAEALDLMDLYQTLLVPVVDPEGMLMGVISEGDVVRALVRNGTNGAPSERTRTVGEVMTTPAIAVNEQMEARVASELMFNRGLKRAPVTSDEGVVVGILTRVDLCQAILDGTL